MAYTSLIKISDLVKIFATFSETSDIIPLDGRGLKEEEVKTGKKSLTTAIQIVSYETESQFDVHTEGCITTVNFALMFIGRDQKVLTDSFIEFLSQIFRTSKNEMGKYIGNRTVSDYVLHEFMPLGNNVPAIPEAWDNDKWYYSEIYQASIS